VYVPNVTTLPPYTTVFWSNHSATRTQIITVVDTQGPVIGQAGADVTVECTATPSFTAPTASDDCNGATVNLLSSTTTGTCTKVITQTWDATDACGNHSATENPTKTHFHRQ